MAGNHHGKGKCLLSPGTVLKDRWELIEKIGSGGFGEIYRVKDLITGQVYALKAESTSNNKQVLRMEALVLKRLQGIEQVCEYVTCGKTETVNYLIMSLLGPNLSELRKKRPNQRFTISTVLRLGIQIIKVIQAMHKSGFLHRDIKPSNFAMGVNNNSKMCYILDFGLSRQYIMPTGELKLPRASAGFRGTVRYASMNAHMGLELGRHDDLWSVFYLLVELSIGQLPWKCMRDKDDVKSAKLSCNHKTLIADLPKEFCLYLEHLQQLTYYDKPNYEYLTRQLEIALERLEMNSHSTTFRSSYYYDWEQAPSPPPPPPPPPISSVISSSSSTLSFEIVPLPLPMKSSYSGVYIVENIFTSSDRNELHNNMSSSLLVTQSNKDGQTPVVDTTGMVDTKSSQFVDDSSLLPHHHHKSSLSVQQLTNYVIPLPPEPKPASYFCANARRKRFVKCIND